MFYFTGCSFSFTVAEDEWKNNEDGTSERTIVKIRELFDVGPVTYPAYPDTTVAVRSLEAFKKKQEDRGAEQEENEIDDERQRQVDKGYRKAGRIINRSKSADSKAPLTNFFEVISLSISQAWHWLHSYYFSCFHAIWP